MSSVFVVKIKDSEDAQWLDTIETMGPPFLVGTHKEKSGTIVKIMIPTDSVQFVTERESQFT